MKLRLEIGHEELMTVLEDYLATKISLDYAESSLRLEPHGPYQFRLIYEASLPEAEE